MIGEIKIMIINMSLVEKSILSIGLILVFTILIYILLRVYFKSRKRMKVKKMLTLNMVIKYKDFKKYVAFSQQSNEQYSLYLVNINNFDLITKKFRAMEVKGFIRRFAKNLSVCLPLGGKLAQTSTRNTFIIYNPVSDINEDEFNNLLVNAVNATYEKNSLLITSEVNISYLSEVSSDFYIDISKLELALIESKRQLGKIIKYNDNLNNEKNEFTEISNYLKSSNFTLNIQKVKKLALNKIEENYYDVLVNNQNYNNWFNKINILDQSWINIYLLEKILIYQTNQQNRQIINLPIVIKSLEQVRIVSVLKRLMDKYQLSIEHTILSINENITEYDQNNVIKNLQTLEGMGFKISLKIDEISNKVYSLVKPFKIMRFEISSKLYEEKSKELKELLHFAKANYLEVLLTDEILEIENDITHMCSSKKEINLSKEISKEKEVF